MVEVEAKFLVDSDEAFAEILQLQTFSAAHRAETAARRPCVDTYYDTRTFELLRQGYSLRLRIRAHQAVWTLKARGERQDGVFAREELECLVEDAPGVDGVSLESSVLPAVIHKRLGRLLGRRCRLKPLCVVTHDRYESTVWRHPSRDSDSTVVGTLTLDAVEVFPPGTASAAGRSAGRFREIEFELVNGGATADLTAVRGRLAELQAAAPSTASKLERAIGMMARWAQRAGPPHAGEPLPLHVKRIWQAQLLKMALHEAGVRAGNDVVAVHDYRVATRRARAVARLFGAYFDPGALGSCTDGLKRTGRTLGPLRDFDVALEDLKAFVKAHPEYTADLQPLGAAWKKERRRALRRARKWLDSKAYGRYIRRFERLCRQPKRGVKPTALSSPSASTRLVWPLAVHAHFARVRAMEAQFEHDRVVPIRSLHGVRIELKRLRYMVEMAPGDRRPARRIVRSLKGLQDVLGALQDGAVALELVEASGCTNSVGLAAFQSHQESRIARAREHFPEVWQAFLSPENRQRLFRMLAEI